METQNYFELFINFILKYPFIKVTLITIILLFIFVSAEKVGESIGTMFYFITHK
ncbi:hypothetical protein [Vulcanibacillus modesticaldus]|uniref:hypothetical protein n=1 Tax=Vulcanibacillus modesticaldus TaxID=337097 RepID=UPI00159F3188|nr:hypothetical protein [Vulcanibacillus modesticaldus]